MFSAQELADVLALKREQGVQIRVLVDPGFAHRSYSEWLDLKGLAMADHRCGIEAGNNPWTTPLKAVGTPRLSRGVPTVFKGFVQGLLPASSRQRWSAIARPLRSSHSE